MQGVVWRVSLTTLSQKSLAWAETLLDDNERQKLAKIRHYRRRTTFIVGRALARCAYLHCYGGEYTALEMVEDQHGRPAIGDGQPFDFNLSHSGEWCVCAFVTQGRIGVDIESHRPGRDIFAIAEHFFHPDEQALIHAAEDSQQCFYQLWVLKEALLKVQGLGLRIPLHQVCFRLQRGQWRYCGELPMAVCQIYLEQGADYQLALITDGPEIVSLPSIELNGDGLSLFQAKSPQI